jgi:pSer/pThr/pTyr-binding forkhead associated (FHA) protein/cold shock CspA family protein
MMEANGLDPTLMIREQKGEWVVTERWGQADTTKSATIGRDKHCTIRFLSNAFVSRQHLKISANLDEEWMQWENMSATNGVLITRKSGEQIELEHATDVTTVEDGDVCSIVLEPGNELEVKVLNVPSPLVATQTVSREPHLAPTQPLTKRMLQIAEKIGSMSSPSSDPDGDGERKNHVDGKTDCKIAAESAEVIRLQGIRFRIVASLQAVQARISRALAEISDATTSDEICQGYSTAAGDVTKMFKSHFNGESQRAKIAKRASETKARKAEVKEHQRASRGISTAAGNFTVHSGARVGEAAKVRGSTQPTMRTEAVRDLARRPCLFYNTSRKGQCKPNESECPFRHDEAIRDGGAKKQTGRVKFFSSEKYYGIIVEDGSGIEVFAHGSQLVTPAGCNLHHNCLEPLAKVKYRRAKDKERKSGWRAEEIEGGFYQRERDSTTSGRARGKRAFSGRQRDERHSKRRR